MQHTSPYAYALNALNKGEVIAIPTEAVYGLSVDAENLSAVEKLLTLKQRDPSKWLIIVASEISQLEPYIQPLPPDMADKLNSTWPGGVGWILPVHDTVYPLFRGETKTIHVRVRATLILPEIFPD